MSTLNIRPIQTRIFHARENLADFICESVPHEWVQEKMILAVTSKIVSLAEGRLVPQKDIDKAALVQREADVFLGEVAYGCYLTIKEGLLIPSAGIDESNSETGDFILYPQDPFQSAQDLWQELRKRWSLRELGILLTDSHTSPLRRGVTGICLSYCGFKGVRNMIGSQDIFGRPLQMTQMNLADAWSTAAVVMMGEGRERCPLAVLSGAQGEFCEKTDPLELKMPLREDLYYPLLQKFME